MGTVAPKGWGSMTQQGRKANKETVAAHTCARWARATGRRSRGPWRAGRPPGWRRPRPASSWRAAPRARPARPAQARRWGRAGCGSRGGRWRTPRAPTPRAAGSQPRPPAPCWAGPGHRCGLHVSPKASGLHAAKSSCKPAKLPSACQCWPWPYLIDTGIEQGLVF